MIGDPCKPKVRPLPLPPLPTLLFQTLGMEKIQFPCGTCFSALYPISISFPTASWAFSAFAAGHHLER